MNLQETAPLGPDDPRPDDGFEPPSQADLRMADLLSDKTKANRERDVLRNEGTPVADDLLGRLNAMDFIDSVLGEDYEMPGRIGDYEIIGVLGRGGMGTVYRAYQASLDREIALKVLAPRFSMDPTMRTRFRTEAKATAAMHHQHIVPIYGYGEASGHLFFAMELVKGVSLDKHITVARRRGEGAMEPVDAARRFAGIADALALAHKRQILHRDVKPGNLLMHDDGTIALADFGLSKFLGEASAQLTSIGGFLGTLYYAPPEQARGDNLGPASDLYSLGVTLFETVTGKLPVYGQTTEAMLNAVLNDTPLRLRDLAPKAPRDLDAVVTMLLQKDPRDRYQDGESLALDLIRIAEGEPVRIRRQSVLVRIYRRVKRNPVVAAIVVVLLVLLVVTSLWFREALLGDRLESEKNGREHIRQASIAVASEPGPPAGLFRMLDALSGGKTVETNDAWGFRSQIDAASELLPDELAKIEGYRKAYAGRALRPAGDVNLIELLRVGNGFAARAWITKSIDAIQAKYNADDLGERMDRYHLHLASAIANLTAAVADPQEALNDLNLANFIRSGADLPRVLQTFLRWKDRSQPNQLINALKVFTEDPKRPELRRATAEFLLSFAGICPPRESQLMRFAMGYATRRILSDKALELLGVSESSADEWYFGLEHELAVHATTAVFNLGNTNAMLAPLTAGRDLLTSSVAPTSPLQAWVYTFDLLADDPNRTASLSDEQRLWGAIHYVRVVQHALSFDDAAVVLRSMEATVAPLLKLAASPQHELRDPAVELSARLHSWVGAPNTADQAADAWLKVNDQDPAAQLCKFCCLVRGEPKTQVAYFRALRHGLNAIQYASNGVRAAVRGSITKRVDHGVANVQDATARGFLAQLRNGLAGD